MGSSSPSGELIPPPAERDDTHKVYSIAIACIVLGVLGSVIIGTRLRYRVRTKTIGIDDYAIIPSSVLYIGWTVLTVYSPLAAGVGKPLHEITLAEYTIWFQSIIAATWLYPSMSTGIRVSIILFYYRMFAKGHGMSFTYVIWALLGLQAIYVVVFSILPAFICRPFRYAWLPIERAPYCSSNYWNALVIALYSVSLAFDIILLFFPIIPVSRLQMPLRKRIGVGVMFAFGASASIAASYKLAVYVVDMPRTQTRDPDWLKYLMSRYIPVQFDNYGVTVWIPGQLEPTLALLGASLPAIYPFCKTIMGRFAIKLSGDRSFNSFHAPFNSEAGRQCASRPGEGGRLGVPGTFHKLNESQVALQPLGSHHNSHNPRTNLHNYGPEAR
ncbi:hypothetical protein DL765_008238 [Monosporascus sp. GIB2]|nr:hypothetical protein DL765_008238 [Monosporascus sp. GIB2]